MPVSPSHGRPYPSPPRADELPTGAPSSAEPPRPGDFDARGKFAPGNGLSRAGGKATAGKTRLSARLGLSSLPEGAAFRPYRAAATSFRRAQCAALAATVGGGMCGPGPSSMVASAALQLAWSRFMSDQAAATGDAELALSASRLADASRNNLLSAHELAAREAVARRASQPTSAHAALTAVLGGESSAAPSSRVEPAPALLPAPLPSTPLAPDEPPIADDAPSSPNVTRATTLPDRVIIGGGPRVGKSTLARRLSAGGRLVRCTDEAAEMGWSEASENVATWLDAPGPWIVEGVAVARALRKWLAAHPTGAPCDVLYWSTAPRADRTPGQVTMGKGCETVLAEIRFELLARGVTIEPFPREGA
jgi:hypothetical protein